MPRRTVAALLVLVALAPWSIEAQRGVPPPAPDPVAATALALAVDRLLDDRWYPGIPRAKGDPPAVDDEAILQSALGSTNPFTRRLAVRSVGRFLNPLDAPFFASLVADRTPGVSDEARFWWARVIALTKEPKAQVEARRQLIDLLEALEPATPVDEVFAALARLGPLDEATAIEFERQWIDQIDKRWPYSPQDPQLPIAIAALDHLQPLLATFPDRTMQQRTRSVLERVGMYGFRSDITGPNLTALEALTAARVTDRQLAQHTLGYFCKGPQASPDCGWEFRRQGVLLTDVRDETFSHLIDDALRDKSMIVRLEMYRRLAATVNERKTCAPFMRAFEDPSPVIRLEAIDWWSPECKERDDIVVRLKAEAVDLGEEPDFLKAPFAARALLTLARFSPADAIAAVDELVASATGWNGIWQYRAAAARTAAIMRDEPFALRFVEDPDTNVQYEALTALHSMNSEARWPHAIRALESLDYRVVFTGAALLRRMPDPEGTMHPLVAALDRLTKDNKDTSRAPRLEIINRLKEIAPPNQGIVILNYYVTRLQPYLKDQDPIIAGAMADVFGLMYGTRPAPAPARRRINQPSASLFSLGSTLTVLLDSGDDFNIELNVEEAPLTVARFIQLAASPPFYDGTFFYRLLPLNLLQAGSTRANDMMSYGRFIRDELGRTPHRHGTVGWFSQGPDTGDSQFFINLLDAPTRHRQYTVLGRVGQGHKKGVIVPGMDVVLDLLEGARIVSIRGASRRR